MRSLMLLSVLFLVLSSCEAYLEEKLEFLEYPFEYEGKLESTDFDPDEDLAWGVPDNGDAEAVYLGTEWGDVYYWKYSTSVYLFGINDSYVRPVASMAEVGRFVYVTDNYGVSDILGFVDLFTAGSGFSATAYDSGELLVSSDLLAPLVANGKSSLMIQTWQISLPSTISYSADIFSEGTVSDTDILAAAFPDADYTWGTPEYDFLAFAPASSASTDGKHKFVVSRSNGTTGDKKVMLVSVDEGDYSLSARKLSARTDFHFISQDRFVGMKGDTLKIFDSDGVEIAGYEFDGMRLLGYRSSTDTELVFLYRSEENGDEVWGIYSLPAEFVLEAR